jgi:hypothetical protein
MFQRFSAGLKTSNPIPCATINPGGSIFRGALLSGHRRGLAPSLGAVHFTGTSRPQGTPEHIGANEHSALAQSSVKILNPGQTSVDQAFNASLFPEELSVPSDNG